MEKPLITVVTASLNSSHTIRSTIESIKHQTFRHFEHIVCDGGSTDATLQILEEYHPDYPLRWVSELDTGISDAMNKGINRARGAYIICIHADDALIGPTALETASNYLWGERYDICCFPILFTYPDGRIRRSSPIRVAGWHRFRNTIRHQGCFVHRRLYEKLSGYKTTLSISADYDFFYRAFQAGASVRYFDQPVAVMGREGVSSDPRFLLKRLEEEQTVQELNEKNPLWRAAQRVFRRLYVPYKTRRIGRRIRNQA